MVRALKAELGRIIHQMESRKSGSTTQGIEVFLNNWASFTSSLIHGSLRISKIIAYSHGREPKDEMSDRIRTVTGVWDEFFQLTMVAIVCWIELYRLNRGEDIAFSFDSTGSG
jgi:hypothetical protein